MSNFSFFRPSGEPVELGFTVIFSGLGMLFSGFIFYLLAGLCESYFLFGSISSVLFFILIWSLIFKKIANNIIKYGVSDSKVLALSIAQVILLEALLVIVWCFEGPFREKDIPAILLLHLFFAPGYIALITIKFFAKLKILSHEIISTVIIWLQTICFSVILF